MTGTPRSDALAALVDPLLRSPAVVVGGLPPEGRDLDLLVDEQSRSAVEAGLQAAGLRRRRRVPGEWLRLAAPPGGVLRADVVDLGGGVADALPAAEQEWLRASSEALPGRTRLHRPAPAGTLLLLARRGVAARPLSSGHLQRVLAALKEQPDAFEVARERASAWNAAAGLEALRDRSRGRAPGALRRFRLAREAQLPRLPVRLGRLRAVREVLPRATRASTTVLVPAADDLERSAADLLAVLTDLGVDARPCGAAATSTVVVCVHGTAPGDGVLRLSPARSREALVEQALRALGQD